MKDIISIHHKKDHLFLDFDDWLERALFQRAMEDGLNYFLIPHNDPAITEHNLQVVHYSVCGEESIVKRILTDGVNARRTSNKSYELYLYDKRISTVTFFVEDGTLGYTMDPIIIEKLPETYML